MSRVLLIGLDGASPDLAELWMQEGRLPHLSRLAARGAFLPLEGLTPPVTYPAWTTCVTGVNPGRHGLVDFTTLTAGRDGIRFMNSRDRGVPALWNILSRAGKRVCVLGVPGTYPPEPVNGILMAGFDSPVADRVDRSFVYPQEAYPRVQAWRFAEFQEHRITPAWYAQALESLKHKIAVKTAVATALMTEEAWDFFMVVFGEADTVSHHFWALEFPDSPRHLSRPGMPEHPIRAIYERLDAAVGALVERMGEDTLVLVVSDHGFGGASTRALHLNNYLAECGWLRYACGQSVFLKRLALRALPVRGRGALFRRFQGLAESLESGARFGGIDWQHTRAWSEELDYFPSVRINLAGRDPAGTVSIDAYEDTVRILCSALEKHPGIERALPRSAVYSGKFTERAPDIILVPAWEHGYRSSFLRARGGLSTVSLPPDKWAGGKEAGCCGVHRNPALLFSSRPDVIKKPALQDIAPSVLDALNLPMPHMEGVSLFGKYRDAAVPTNNDWTPLPEKPYTDEEAFLLESRMRALGYYE